ncbi:hypothetical protein KP79_PYT15077 [Mizuhopecten yessoensis]|uniref:Uncharacterized protein n=1 Tax=Mizuhopecten yessoensis TaxID=6573 RepID=A0A210Q6Z4_MIZYE|nr:hypothetical protein KP79_PYT15077 [Mizuhopecten yessoensis]
MAYMFADDAENMSPTIEDILSHPDYNLDEPQKAMDREMMCKAEALEPRPIACFLYSDLTTKKLRAFLIDRGASAACILHHLTRLNDICMPPSSTEKLTALRPITSVQSIGTSHVMPPKDGHAPEVVNNDNLHKSKSFDYTILTPQKSNNLR